MRRRVADRLIRRWVAQHLRADPVLAVGAVEVTPQHAEGEGITAGQHVEERLLFDRVSLQTSHITPGDTQLASLVEAHLADTAPPITDQAAVGARHTAHGVIWQRFRQLHILDGHFIQDFFHGLHRILLLEPIPIIIIFIS